MKQQRGVLIRYAATIETITNERSGKQDLRWISDVTSSSHWVRQPSRPRSGTSLNTEALMSDFMTDSPASDCPSLAGSSGLVCLGPLCSVTENDGNEELLEATQFKF